MEKKYIKPKHSSMTNTSIDNRRGGKCGCVKRGSYEQMILKHGRDTTNTK